MDMVMPRITIPTLMVVTATHTGLTCRPRGLQAPRLTPTEVASMVIHMAPISVGILAHTIITITTGGGRIQYGNALTCTKNRGDAVHLPRAGHGPAPTRVREFMQVITYASNYI
jgi:hypothetical protein